MNKNILIKDAIIVNEHVERQGSVLIEDSIITKVFFNDIPGKIKESSEIIEAQG